MQHQYLRITERQNQTNSENARDVRLWEKDIKQIDKIGEFALMITSVYGRSHM